MIRFLRGLAPWLVVFLFIGSFAGVVWLTYYPETPWLEAAEEWPVLGLGARWIRDTYLPPEPVEVAEGGEEGGPGTEIIYLTPDGKRWDPDTPIDLRARGRQGQVQGSLPSTIQPPTRKAPRRTPIVATPHNRPLMAQPEMAFVAEEWSWFLPGNPVRREPKAEAAMLRPLPALSYLPVLEKRGNWVSVVLHGKLVWVDSHWRPPFTRRSAQRGILRQRYEPVEKGDWERVRRARRLMGIDKPRGKVGAYKLFTDVEDQELLEFLDQAATMAEEAYFARYGRLPSGNPRHSVVLFATEADYRTFSKKANCPLSNHRGHAGSGVVAMYVEGQRQEELARILVHEIAHLLNNRAVAWRLPPWLEEGMASDLGAIWMENAPTLGANSLAGNRSMVSEPEVRLQSLDGMRRKGTLPSVDILWRLDTERFYADRVAHYGYSHAAALVTFFLEGEDGRYAPAFRDFLKKIAAGQGPDPRTLMKLLEMDPPAIDQAFQGWLQREAEARRDALRERGVRLATG